MPETTIITTVVQLGAFGVLAYLVIRWQREDLAKRSDEIKALTEKSIAAQNNVADHLALVAEVLGQICGRLDIQADTPSPKGTPHV